MKDYFLAAIEARDLLSEAIRETRPDTLERYEALRVVDPTVLIRLQTAALQHASEGNLAPAAAAAIEAVQSAVFGLKAVSVFARSASTLEWEAAENALNDAMLRLQPYVRLEQQPAAEPAAPAAPAAEPLTPLEKALAMLVKNPDRTDKQIAEDVGVHPKTMNKPAWKKYKAARAALAGNVRKGSKVDGRIEAADEANEPEIE